MEQSQLDKIWLASTESGTLSPADIMSFDLEKAAQLALTADMSLRQEGNYMYGLARIWAARASLLLKESQEMDEGFGRAFKEYLEKIAQENQLNDGLSKRATNLHDFDFDQLSIPSSLLSDPIGSSGNNDSLSSDAGERPDVLRSSDLSFDDIMRADEDGPLGGDVDTLTRSAEQQAALASEMNLDLGGIEYQSLEPLDYGDELAYSSSPPHTPLGSEDEGVTIHGEDENEQENARTDVSKQGPRPRRRRQGAAVDEDTTIVRYNRPPARILRKLPEPPLNPTTIMPDTSRWPLDESLEKMVDPEFVYAEMKKRRSAGSATQESQPDVEMPDEIELEAGDMDLDLDVGMELEPLDYGDEDEREPEITEEMLEEEEKHAKQVLKTQLGQRGKSMQFDDLASGAQSRASLFMEVLGQAAKGRLRAQQERPFGPIRLTRV